MRCAQLAAVQTWNGNIVTEPEAVAEALRERWERTLRASVIDRDLLLQWQEALQQPLCGSNVGGGQLSTWAAGKTAHDKDAAAEGSG